MKSFFDENDESYLKDASEAAEEFSQAIKPIFNKWLEKGYTTREIEYIANDAVAMFACGRRLQKRGI